MATADDVADLSNNSSQSKRSQNPETRKRLGAALASAFFPGLGQLLLGATSKAIVYFLFVVLVIFLYWPVRLPRTYGGLIFVGWLTLLLVPVAAWDALRTERSKYQRASGWWLALFVPLGLLAAILYVNGLFRASGFRNYSLPSSSMEPTIEKGNLFVGDMFAYRSSAPRPYDLIIFRKDKTPYVKRVIAGPGSTIEGKADEIMVDGKRVSEPYVQHVGAAVPELSNFGPVLIPPGKLFVMGDNRDVSYDSRIPKFGLVDMKDVLGKPLYICRSAEGWRGKRVQ
jgi:signal peptidase I